MSPSAVCEALPSCLLCDLGSSVAPSDSTLPSLQASQQQRMGQWRRQQWQRLEDQVGRCAGQAAPRHASCAGEGKSPANLCGCVCPAPLSPQPRGGGRDREAPPRPDHPGLFLQESATVREPKQNYAPINKEKLPFPLALHRPISKPSFWAIWSLPSLALTGSEGSLPWVSDPLKRHRVGSLSSQF